MRQVLFATGDWLVKVVRECNLDQILSGVLQKEGVPQMHQLSIVSIDKSDVILREQLLKAGQTNLSPQFIQVYVSGRVVSPGGVTLPQGSALNQAINLAGGTRLLKGKVEFIRFTREGKVDRRVFSYNPNAASTSYNNPIPMAGDIVSMRDGALSAGIGLLNEVATPFVGVYGLYSAGMG